MREKRYGVWKPMTWREFQANVRRFALGLLSLGFEEGNNLAIIGDNKPEWIVAELGSMAAGGLPTGAYPDNCFILAGVASRTRWRHQQELVCSRPER